MKKLNMNLWTIMVMSDAKKPVIYFRFPKVVFYFILLSIVILLLTLANSYKVTLKLQQEKIKVTQDLNKLQMTHQALVQEAVEVQEQIDDLREIEIKMREMSDYLKPGVSSTVEKSKAQSSSPMGGLESVVKSEAFNDGKFEEIKSQIPDLIEKSEATLTYVEKLKKELSITPSIWPTKTRNITSPFGNRRDPFTNRPSMHLGVDIAGAFKSPIYATADGKVIFAGYNGGYGNMVVIKHSAKYKARYAHLANYTLSFGEKVKKGQVVGYMGSTGRSTGVHLHYEVIKNGSPVDPFPYISYSN